MFEVVKDLVKLKVAPLHPLLRRSAALAYTRRWWSLLSVALHNSISESLDPELDVSACVFPVADAVDVWMRDPGDFSALGLPGR